MMTDIPQLSAEQYLECFRDDNDQAELHPKRLARKLRYYAQPKETNLAAEDAPDLKRVLL